MRRWLSPAVPTRPRLGPRTCLPEPAETSAGKPRACRRSAPSRVASNGHISTRRLMWTNRLTERNPQSLGFTGRSPEKLCFLFASSVPTPVVADPRSEPRRSPWVSAWVIMEWIRRGGFGRAHNIILGRTCSARIKPEAYPLRNPSSLPKRNVVKHRTARERARRKRR